MVARGHFSTAVGRFSPCCKQSILYIVYCILYIVYCILYIVYFAVLKIREVFYSASKLAAAAAMHALYFFLPPISFTQHCGLVL